MRSPAITDAEYRPDATADPLTAADRRACVLDVYAATNGHPIATLVWFHGGGMTSGDKAEAAKLANLLADAGVCVVDVNYRLSPTVKYPAYVEDAAVAVAWTMAHADTLATPPGGVFVGGYSAGGYLAAALATDPQWLAAVGHTPADLRGVIGISPQVFTHYTIRLERGIADPQVTPLIDAAAPVFHASANTPPMRLFCGDHDTPTRREEIEYFVAILKAKKQTDTTLTVVKDRTHGTMFGKAAEAGDVVGTGMIDFIRTHAASPATQPAVR